MATQKSGKKNALLGGLLVFIIPLFFISLIYYMASRFPKPKQIPIIQSAEEIGDWQLISYQDIITNDSLPVDVKFIFQIDSTNLKQRVLQLADFTEDSKTYPEFSLKEPYAQTYFLAVSDSNLVLPDSLYHWIGVQEVSKFPVDLSNQLLIIDNNGNLRGQYKFAEEDLAELKLDLQYLLQEMYYSNSEKIRIKKMFKSPEDFINDEK